MSDDDEGDLFAEDDSDDDEVVVSPKKKPAATAAAAAAAKKPAAAAAAKKKGDDDDSDDSDDTAELFSRAKSKSTKAAAVAKHKAKKAAAPPKVIAKKKKDDDDDDDDDDGGLFDSSDEDDDNDDGGGGKKKAKATTAKKPAQSRRERLEALAKKKRVDDNDDDNAAESLSKTTSSRNKDKVNNKDSNNNNKKDDKSGYESADSIDSATFQRTKEDDDFLDTTGEDADAVHELYAEQHFDDEPEDMEDNGPGKKKRRYNNNSSSGGGSREDYGKSGGDGEEPDNPIMAAVHRMKKKKREKRSLTEMEDEGKAFLSRMELAAEQDEALMVERKPATRKLQMLHQVVDMLNRKDMQRTLLELDVLVVCKRWIQPLPNGTLGNVTVRQRLLHVIAEMKGDNGITPNDLKRSEFGKVIMILFKHPSETPTLKRQCKALVEQWSRPIFQKSGNMRDLERVHHLRGEGTGGLASIRRQQAQVEAATARAVMMQQRGRTGGGPASNNKDLQSIIASGKKGGADGPASANRVRVPFSKGFAFSVRPEVRADVQQQQQAGGGGAAGGGAGKGASPPKDGNRGKLNKRMLEKSRTKGKNERSANISVVGRANKG